MIVASVTPNTYGGDKVVNEEIKMHCVCGNQPFGPNGESEDNSFARWSPSGNLNITVTNPNLFGKFVAGQKFYIDMTPAAE